MLNAPSVSTPNYRTTISISNLLDYVNKYFPDILPEGVLRHYGYTERPQGVIGESARNILRRLKANKTLQGIINKEKEYTRADK